MLSSLREQPIAHIRALIITPYALHSNISTLSCTICTQRGALLYDCETYISPYFIASKPGLYKGFCIWKFASVLVTSQCLYKFRLARALVTSQGLFYENWRRFRHAASQLYTSLDEIVRLLFRGTTVNVVVLIPPPSAWIA